MASYQITDQLTITIALTSHVHRDNEDIFGRRGLEFIAKLKSRYSKKTTEN